MAGRWRGRSCGALLLRLGVYEKGEINAGQRSSEEASEQETETESLYAQT